MAVFWLFVAGLGNSSANLLHCIEGSRGEAVQLIRVDQIESLMLHRVEIRPLLPVTQSVRILTPCQDQRWVGPDHLFHVHLRVRGLGIRHDVDPAAEFDGLSRPGIATDAGERRVPELVEHLDAGWLAIALLQGMQTRQIAIGGFVGTLLHPSNLPSARISVASEAKSVGSE